MKETCSKIQSQKKGGVSQIFYIFHNLAHVVRRNLHLLIHYYSILQIIKQYQLALGFGSKLKQKTQTNPTVI